MGADQKQAAVTKKPSVSLASLNASHPLTKTAPSVKSVTGTQASCSKQETQTSWPQRALDTVKDVLLGAGNAFGRTMINGGAALVKGGGLAITYLYEFFNRGDKNAYERDRKDWSNYIDSVAGDITGWLESTTRGLATNDVYYDGGQIIGDAGILVAEYFAFLKAAKVVSGAIKGISGMILADEAASSVAVAGAGTVAQGVTFESYLAVAAEVFLNFSAFKNDWNRLQEDWKESEAKEAEEAGGEPEISDGTGNRGELTGKLDGLTVDERNMVNDLLDQGKNVEIIPKTAEHKTPDFYVDGVLTELKTLNGSSLNTAVTRIQDGFAQGAQTVIIDARKTGMTLEQAQTVIDRAIGSFSGNLPGNVEIWTIEGVLLR